MFKPKQVLVRTILIAAGMLLVWSSLAPNASAAGPSDTRTSADLTAPIVLAIASYSPDTATVYWVPSDSAGVQGYRLYVAPDGGSFALAKTVEGGSSSSLTATGLDPGTSYYFLVTAVDAQGQESSASEVAAMGREDLGTAQFFFNPFMFLNPFFNFNRLFTGRGGAAAPTPAVPGSGGRRGPGLGPGTGTGGGQFGSPSNVASSLLFSNFFSGFYSPFYRYSYGYPYYGYGGYGYGYPFYGYGGYGYGYPYYGYGGGYGYYPPYYAASAYYCDPFYGGIGYGPYGCGYGSRGYAYMGPYGPSVYRDDAYGPGGPPYAGAPPAGPPRPGVAGMAAFPVRASSTPEGVALSWAAVEGARTYSVIRCSAGQCAPLASTSDPRYSDTSAATGATYSYMVIAFAADGSPLAQSAPTVVRR